VTLTRHYNTLACITVFLGILCYAIADGKPSMALLAGPVVFAGWLAGKSSDAPWALPRNLINLLVLLAVLNSIVQTIVLRRHEALVSDLSDFLVFVQLIKLFDRRRARDDAQLLALSLFIVIGAILTDNSLGVGICILAYAPIATWTVMRYQIHAGQQDMAEASAWAGVAPHPPVATGSRHIRHLRRLTTASIVVSLFVSFVIFVVMPRGLGGDAFGALGRPIPGSSSGFVSNVSLGATGVISLSQRPVMDVRVLEDGRSAGADNFTLYLRGTVQDEYDPDSGRWSRAAEHSPFQPPVEEQAAGTPLSISPPLGRISQLHVRLRSASHNGGYLFTMWRPAQLTVAHPLSMEKAGDFVVRYHGAPTRSLEYTVDFTRDSTDTMRSALRRTRTPPGVRSSRVRELAESILTERGVTSDSGAREAFENRQIINAFQTHLRRTCSYTLEPGLPPSDREPIEWFLFESQRGHCEYFASALVAMCWSVGLDARLVAGYVATEYNDSNESYLVREANAHAWVEAELAPGRWATFDPTPPGDLDRIHRARPGLLGRLRRFYERLEFGWATGVVSFDASQRASIYDATLGRSSMVESLRRELDALTRRARALLPTTLLQGAISFALLAVSLVALWLFGRLLKRRFLIRARSRRKREASDAELRSLLRQAAFYADALALLERAGVPKPSSTPPLAHAQLLDSALADPFVALTRLFYRVRFRRTPLGAQEAEAARTHLERLREAVAER
jgi:hypothetical protein